MAMIAASVQTTDRPSAFTPTLVPLLAVLAIVLAMTPLEDPDTWFHLAGGRLLWQSGVWPATNTFSFAATTYPYIDLHWVFQLILYTCYQLGGVNGCIALTIALVLAAVGLLYATARRSAPPVVVVPLIAAAVTIATPRLVPRPELVSIALLAAYLWILERRPLDRLTYLIVPLQILWVNSHGLFAVGLVLIACYWAGAGLAFLDIPLSWREASRVTAAEWRRLTIVLVLASAACFINPYGIQGVVFPLILLPKVTGGSIFSMRIAELLPPFATDYAPALTWTWAGLLAVAALSFIVNRRSMHLGRFFVVAAFGFLSTRTLRNMALFGWIAAPAVAANLGDLLNRRTARTRLRGERRRRSVHAASDRGRPRADLIVAASLVLLIAIVATNRFALALGLKRQLGGGVSAYVPANAIEFARDAGIEGRPFNCMVVGGLLAWRRFPGQAVFIDGRTEAYPETLFAAYFGVIDDPQKWPAFASQYGFDYAVLEHTALDRWPLSRYLSSGHGWVLAYYDEVAALFLPTDDAHRAMRERAERAFGAIEAGRVREPLRPTPGRLQRMLAFPVTELQIQIGYGDFLRFIGRNLEAVRAYQHALVLDPDSLDVRLALGGAYWSAGNRDQATQEWGEILRRDPGFERARAALDQAGFQRQ